MKPSTVSKIVRQSQHTDYAATEDCAEAWEPQIISESSEPSSRSDAQLLEWIDEARMKGINVTRDMIRAQAAIFAYSSLSQMPPSPSSASSSQSPNSTSTFTPVADNLPFPFPLGQDPAAKSYFSGSGLNPLPHPCRNLTATNNQNYSHTISSTDIFHPPGTNGQHGFLYDTLAHCSTDDPVLDVEATTTSSRLRGKDSCTSTIYAELLASRTGAVSSVDARSAFDAVETYLLNSPAMTALDQLCLSHVKACLDRF